MSTILRALAALLIVMVVGLAVAPDAFAQAWVPEKGGGSVSVAVQELNVKKHYATTTQVDAGHINTVVLLADVTYGITDKLAFNLAIPFVSSAYAGPKPHPGTDVDNGEFHSAFTDVRFSVRYNVSRKGAVFTPYIGSIVPSHDYAFYGHSAAGERLRELQVGTFVASCSPVACRDLSVRTCRLRVCREGAGRVPQSKHGRSGSRIFLHARVSRLCPDQRAAARSTRTAAFSFRWADSRLSTRVQGHARCHSAGQLSARGRRVRVFDQ